ncbi:hypothetical protein NKH72_21970 [Mesorhizobium sp. M0955]|uniref:hypothetical protein n=1 Tax=Mesorhizobium sp. M0955 TaxID=2957033 RepID=UPI003334C9BD
MAEAVEFVGSNFKFTAPAGDEDRIRDLPCFVNGNAIVTCWELSAEEFASVVETGKIWISQLSGKAFYPMFVGNARSVREVVADTGITIPRQERE